MTAGIEERPLVDAEEVDVRRLGIFRRASAALRRFATLHIFTSLTRRILLLNLGRSSCSSAASCSSTSSAPA
mgnify:CR=1 FL=1